MGLFDYVYVEYRPLPGTSPEWLTLGSEFQTKDFDDPFMNHYIISEDGRLLFQDYTYGTDESHPLGISGKLNELVELGYHGMLTFYGSNWAGFGYGRTYTPNGEDLEQVEYKAKFTDGRLVDITQTLYKREPAFPVSQRNSDWAEARAKEKRDKPIKESTGSE